jgi:hypothetical protein
MNIKQLKEVIKDLPDDMVIVALSSDIEDMKDDAISIGEGLLFIPWEIENVSVMEDTYIDEAGQSMPKTKYLSIYF